MTRRLTQLPLLLFIYALRVLVILRWALPAQLKRVKRT